jgi:WD40 repeat protein
VRLWNVMSRANTFTLQGHSGGVGSVAFFPDGKRLVSGGYDGSVQLWDVVSGANTATLGLHSPGDVRLNIRSVAIDANALICHTHHDETVIWDLTCHPPRIDHELDLPSISSVYIRCRWIEIFQRVICQIPPLYSPIYSTLSISGDRIAFACEDGRIVILSTENLDI